ncbi:phospholipase D-like domain-containing protein [Natronolimnohabitans sp. A-GB9]|uniref:phospholipase D-like domain-containing protein n=1 Tax=Natronolimnohabitans sp. A-GB9 TaxID=3069757 RepID=UPI0027B416DD|nr:phospholipase D-like domain-containing protein [Natronolimnohabitans sp. A-GB9]MDQ2049128.1 phospholipase D-like domain-containing protein [Natronolimnohabitans sp. A-GB9]
MDPRPVVLVALVGLTLCTGGAMLQATSPPTFSGDEVSASTVSPTPLETEPTCPRAVTEPIEGNDTGSNTTPTEPRIVELYPNPTIRDNVGEYLVLEVPAETTLGNWTLTDGHTTATFPNETVSGRVALSLEPTVTAELTDDPVYELEGHVRLAADGDELELRNETTTVDTVAYDRAPLAERWYRSDSDGDAAVETPAEGTWHPRGGTCLPVSTADVDAATAFVLPDGPETPREAIHEADERLLVAGYTITSETIADDLVAAADRGVDVRVLVESGPVGGTPAATEDVLETLTAGDVEVRAIGGEGARYRYHHPKYAVADDRVIVTTENWKPAGVGGEGSRGWGVVLEDETLAGDLAAVFAADYGGWDTDSGTAFLSDATFVEDDGDVAPSRSYPTEHEPETVPVETAELLVAPDNAETQLTELLAGADEEILVKQASIDADAAVLEETIEAARRGVDVTILLDSTWYHEDENAALASDLEELAAAESLSLEVALVEETDRFEKIHAKGVVVDREVAVVGSANWNANAFENNREVLLALHGEAVANYYATVFEDDWTGDGRWTLPFGVSVTVIVVLALAALVGRRYVRFGESGSRDE